MWEIPQDATHHTTSGGHLTGASYLDDHFHAAQAEYEQMLRLVGIRPGWRVIDVGCRGWAAIFRCWQDLVGEAGHIAATDIAAENVQQVAARIQRGEFTCSVEAHAASATHLPFPDDWFDGLWCAILTQYLDDAQFQAALTEFVAPWSNLADSLPSRNGMPPPGAWALFPARRSCG